MDKNEHTDDGNDIERRKNSQNKQSDFMNWNYGGVLE